MSIRWTMCGLALPLLLGTAQAAPPKGTPLYIELPDGTLPADIGAGGFVLAGGFYPIGGSMWMPTSGTTLLGGTHAVAVSADGKTIVGNALDASGFENAALWGGGRDWHVLGSFTPNARPCDKLLSSSYGASDDGKVVVGLGWDGCSLAHAFRWEESTGMVDLGSINSRSTRANGVSGDGQVVYGWQEDTTGFRMGAKWVNKVEQVIPAPHGLLGEAFGSNRDASIIVGGSCNPNDPSTPSAWTWTATSGVTCYPVPRPAGLPAPFYNAYMYAPSDDGRVIVGAYTFGLESESLIWFDGEVFFLKDYLRANGVPDAFRGWVNTGFALAITPDGRTIVGYGAGPRTFKGYMVVLPELDKK